MPGGLVNGNRSRSTLPCDYGSTFSNKRDEYFNRTVANTPAKLFLTERAVKIYNWYTYERKQYLVSELFFNEYLNT